MFQIKICGITDEDDAKMAVDAGVDALGLNFFSESRRYIDFKTADKIIGVLPSRIVKVGLFVNEGVEAVTKAFDTLGLDLIQLHGDEPPEYLAELSPRPMMKVFRLGVDGLQPIEKYLENCRRQAVGELVSILLDSHVTGVYGGTGTVADWATCAAFAKNPSHPPLVLAGGLTPENVGQAIRAVRPIAVDTASGVEASRGKKDRRLVASFIENARAAFLSKDM